MFRGHSAYEIIDGAVTYDIDSHVLAASARVKLGAAFLNCTVFTGRNAGNLILVSVSGDNRWDDGFDGGEATDAQTTYYGIKWQINF